MPVFAANLTMLFTEAPFLDRFALAREAGFDWVEYLFPYAFTPAELKEALDRMGYQGQVGLEYVPSPDTRGAFSWIKAMGYSFGNPWKPS